MPTADGDLVAVVAADGATLWTATTGTAAIAAQPAVAGAGGDAIVYVGTAAGGVQALAASADGCGNPMCTPLWSTTTGSEITGGPIVTGGRVYVTTADGRLIAHGLP